MWCSSEVGLSLADTVIVSELAAEVTSLKVLLLIGSARVCAAGELMLVVSINDGVVNATDSDVVPDVP